MVDFYRFSLLETTGKLLHAVTRKEMDVLGSFSLALHTGEDPDVVVNNRKYLKTLLSQERELCFVTAQQTHSDHVHIVRQKQTCGWYTQKDAIADCVALITDQKGVMLWKWEKMSLSILSIDRMFWKRKTMANIC